MLFLPWCIITVTIIIIMRPSSLGGGRILRRTLSARLSVRPSRYRCHWLRLFGPASVTSRHLANYNDTHVLFGTH